MRCVSDYSDVLDSVNRCGDINIISPEMTRNLLERSKKGDKDAKDMLVMKNMSIVLNLAEKHYIPTVELSDLVSAGIVGLIKAIDKFELSYENGFLTYATYSINDEINKALKNTSKTMHITFEDHKNLKKAYAISKRLKKEGVAKKQERTEIIAKELNLSTEKVTNLFRSSEIPASYDVPISSEEDSETMLSFLEDSKYDSPEKSVFKSLTIEKLHKAISFLPEKQKEVIILRFGLYRHEPMSCSEIGKSLGCSKAWISQLEHKAIDNLKNSKYIKELEEYPF